MRESIVRSVDQAIAELMALRQAAEQEIEEALFWAHFATLGDYL